jgi:hypothetical protein
MDELPPDVTLPILVWQNVAEDLRAIAEAIDAQLGSFGPTMDEESFLTLRFPVQEVHAALELIARGQIGEEAFDEMMTAIYDEDEA